MMLLVRVTTGTPLVSWVAANPATALARAVPLKAPLPAATAVQSLMLPDGNVLNGATQEPVVALP
jgi:hypothetical protein